MHKLGEQWIEIIDGQEHMVKEVGAISYGNCNGCFLFTAVGCGKVTDFAPCSYDTIIKDLGILNEDGCLPCYRCGGYPDIIGEDKDGLKAFFHLCKGDGEWMVKMESRYYATKQEAIDAWNRRG